MNKFRIAGSVMLALGIFGICSAEGCPETKTSKADPAPVVSCDKSGYKASTFKQRRAKGAFFTCGGPYCKVTTNFPSYTDKSGVRHSDVKTHQFLKYPGNFNIPANAKNWSSIGCGTTYKKVGKSV